MSNVGHIYRGVKAFVVPVLHICYAITLAFVPCCRFFLLTIKYIISTVPRECTFVNGISVTVTGVDFLTLQNLVLFTAFGVCGLFLNCWVTASSCDKHLLFVFFSSHTYCTME